MADSPDAALPLGEEVEGEVELEEGAESGGKGRKIVLLVVTLLGLGAGGVVGNTTLGDSLGPILAERSQASSDAEAGGGGGHGGEDGEGGGGAASMHLVDNLVVNPARSQGTRFLLTSIAIQVGDPSMVSIVAGSDVEIRHALIIVLGAKTVEELTDITLRQQITQELHDVLVELIGPDVIHSIFIPQFVIQ